MKTTASSAPGALQRRSPRREPQYLPPRLHTAPSVPLRKALVAHVVSALMVLSLMALAPPSLSQPDALFAWALVQGALAALLGLALRMERWWLSISLLFVPTLTLAHGLDLPPIYPLGAFVILAVLFSCVVGTSFSFVDLGCGLGGVLHQLARSRPAGRFEGVELALAPFLIGWLRACFGARCFDVRCADFRRIDLAGYDVVYAYLSSAAMPGLWEQARRQMRPGSLLVSNSFGIPGVPPSATRWTGARDGSRLLLWRM
jgi:SAM-dependent methyltransferase